MRRMAAWWRGASLLSDLGCGNVATKFEAAPGGTSQIRETSAGTCRAVVQRRNLFRCDIGRQTHLFYSLISICGEPFAYIV